MPNHVHLLLECSGSPLGKFMQGLQQSYTQYYNRTYHKVGHRALPSDPVPERRLLLELVRYIHLNPARSKLVAMAEKYLSSAEGSSAQRGQTFIK